MFGTVQMVADDSSSWPGARQRARMTRDGYVVARGLFDLEQIRQISQWTTALAAAPEISGRHWVYHEASTRHAGRQVVQRIENFCPFHEGFSGFIEHGIVRRYVSGLLGGPVVLFKDKINFKMPGGAGFQPHQDQQAGWSRYAPLFVTAMVSIDSTTADNGCLEMAPRRTGAGLMGEEWTPLDAAQLTLRPLPTAPGDVVFFDSFVPHGSRPNLTDSARRVLYLTYNLAAHGDLRSRYFADKHAAFPPDIDRDPRRSYVFRV